MRGRVIAPVIDERAARSGGEGAKSTWSFEERSPHLGLIESLSFYTGRMQPLPEWADSGVLLGLQVTHGTHGTKL